MKSIADQILDETKIKEAKMSEEELVKAYDKAEDENDRWGSGILLADWLGNKKFKKWLEVGEKIHLDFGSIPPGLSEFREFLKKDLIKQIQKKFKDKNLAKELR